MERLFIKNDTPANKISYYHLMVFMASLPFNFFYSHIVLISFIIHTLIQLNRADIKPIFTVSNLLLQSVFFVTLLSTLYTINRPQAFNEWGRHISILLFPILFSLTSFDIRKYRNQLLLSFSLICTATITYLYVDAFYTIRFYGLPYKYIISKAFTNQNFAEPISMHATFFSLQVAIAWLYLFSILLKEQSNYYRAFYIICLGILSAGLIQLSSKSVCAPMFFIINLAVPYFLLQGKSRMKFICIAASLSVLLLTGILTSGIFKARYIADLKYDVTLTSKNNRFDSRLDRWTTAIDLIKQKPIIGYGAGAELGLLHDSFFTRKYYNSFINNLNAHNQYLSLLIKSGIIGLLIYLTALGFGFKKALKRKDLLFFTFMLLITGVSFSENLLDVDKGIMFYAFYFSFFIFSGNTSNIKPQNV